MIDPRPPARRTLRTRALGLAIAASLAGGAFANAPVVTSSVKPKKILSTLSGGTRTWFVDFGPAYFGSLSFRLSNSGAQQTAQIAISEAASASAIITNAIGARTSTATVTVAAGSKDYSQFTDQPIRACRLQIPDPSVTLDTSSIVLIAKHVPFPDTASAFTSSDTVLNRVYGFCKHSVKATSFQGAYIDGIRETKPYEGDTYINMLSHLGSDANPPIALFTHEYLLTHPTWPWEYRLMSILIGWELYMATGGIDQLQRNYSVLAARIQSGIGSGSWSDSIALADWPVAMRDGYDSTSRGGSVTNAWAYKAFMTIADMADALGKPSEASAYRARAAQTKNRFNDSLLLKGQGLYRDGMATSHTSLHGNMYPLALGVVPDSLKKTVGKYLVSRGMACNVYGAQFLLDALFEAGYDSAAIALMTARTTNSWMHMLDQVGATITMEAWDPAQKPNLDWNHAWATAPANIIPRRVFGILPLSPGYAKFMIKPQVGTLASGSYALPTVKGTITVAFESRRGQSLKVTAGIPAGAYAKAYVPAYGSAEIPLPGCPEAGPRGWLVARPS
jgi:alpha-L-rhamnosidase